MLQCSPQHQSMLQCLYNVRACYSAPTKSGHHSNMQQYPHNIRGSLTMSEHHSSMLQYPKIIRASLQHATSPPQCQCITPAYYSGPTMLPLHPTLSPPCQNIILACYSAPKTSTKQLNNDRGINPQNSPSSSAVVAHVSIHAFSIFCTVVVTHINIHTACSVQWSSCMWVFRQLAYSVWWWSQVWTFRHVTHSVLHWSHSEYSYSQHMWIFIQFIQSVLYWWHVCVCI